MNRLRSILFVFFALSLLVWHQQSAAGPTPAPTPENLGDLKTQLTRYKRSGAYDREMQAAVSTARRYLERRARTVRKPALVLDIDETSLSNWPEIQANDYGRILNGPCNLPAGPCGQTAWFSQGDDEAIGPTLALFNTAKALGVTVFFLTGRSEILRSATEMNLHKAGYDGWARLIMRPTGTTTPSAADFKAPERATIVAQGFTIIANVGDQPSDLAGGYAVRTFLVPNPFYRIP
jgi:predicted secreted acid phosphatase